MNRIETVENPFWEKLSIAIDRLHGCKFAGEYNSETREIKVKYISRSVTSFKELADLMWSMRDAGIDSIVGGYYE